MTVIKRNESQGSSANQIRVRVDSPAEQRTRDTLDGNSDDAGKVGKLDYKPSIDPAYDHLANIGRAISTAQSALSAVGELRDKQYALANNSADSPDPERRAAYQAEFEDIQDEITRVQSSATFNGVNVLEESNTYDLKVVDQGGSGLQIEDNRSIVTGVSQSVFSNYGLSLASSSDAALAAEALDDISRVTRSAVNGVSSAYSKAADAVKTKSPNAPSQLEAGSQVRDVAEAEALVQKVASNIRDLAGRDDSGAIVKELIESVTANIEPERVRELL